MQISYKEIGPGSIADEMTMPLISLDYKGNVIASGTAVLIAPFIAITASHVIEELIEKFDNSKFREGPFEASFDIRSYLFRNGKPSVALSVVKIWRSGPIDISIIQLRVHSEIKKDFKWKVPAIDLLPPKVGTPIVAHGFPNSITNYFEDESKININLHIDPHVTTGEVLEIHHDRRDSFSLPFPCYRVNARFDGGMSGGPVFNNTTGHLCGVICSNIPPACQDGEHISYVSSLWPIIGIPVDLPVPPENKITSMPFYNFIEIYKIFISDKSQASLKKDENGKFQPSVNYDIEDWDGSLKNKKSIKTLNKKPTFFKNL